LRWHDETKEYGMGMLVDGKWQTRNEVWGDETGRFRRTETQFRNWVTADGSPGPRGDGGFAAASGRYHLYVSLACPWAHRTLIMRALKGLEDLVSLSVVHWLMGEEGWSFEPGEGVIGDPVLGAEHLHEIYAAAKPDYTGRVTVPVLWDTERATIVNNESAEIIRMFNAAFDRIGARPGDYYPEPLRYEIDAVNHRVYDTVNNGVYKAGFATTQEAYEEAVVPLFETLDWLEERLSRHSHVAGERFTEADIRLFTTLVRFDPVYHGHFKCNVRRLVDYPRLWALTREIYQMPEVRKTVNFDHIKRHYYMSHRSVNPTGIVPVGPDIDFDAPIRGLRASA
jgi:putative glutathione S-transferase